MRRLLLCSAILVCSWPATAHACDTVATATPGSTCVVLERESVRGLWFDLGTGNGLRKAKLLVPELKLQTGLLESKLEARDFQLESYRSVLKLKNGIQKEQQRAIGLLTKQERQAREALDAWYRSPVLWFAVGVVVPIVGGAIIAALIKD